jgi:hypothetical protein
MATLGAETYMAGYKNCYKSALVGEFVRILKMDGENNIKLTGLLLNLLARVVATVP